MALVLTLALSSTTANSAQTGANWPRDLSGVRLPGLGTSMPKIIHTPLPELPPEAVAAKLRGVIELEITVGRGGGVVHALVTKPIDQFDLDQAVLNSTQGWTFEPATSNGQIVPVLVLAPVTIDASAPKKSTVTAKIAEVPDSPDISTQPALPGTQEPSPDRPELRPPAAVRIMTAAYTSEAMRKKIQGDVELLVVIGTDGTVRAVRVVKSLDATYGLDAQAVRTASHWLFKSGTLNGQPVPVQVTLILSFRLH
jgi:TonB family protein